MLARKLQSRPALLPPRRLPADLSLGLFISVLVLLAALVAPWLAPYDPQEQHYTLKRGAETILSPFPPGPEFWLGSDVLGRDLFSRLLWGARPTLVIAAAVLAARLATGTLLGLLAGWFGGWLDEAVSLMTSWITAFPSLLLAIVVLEVLQGNRNPALYVAGLCLVGWAEVAAYVRQQVQSIAHAPFVDGATALGSGPVDMLRRHVWPNLVPQLWSLAALEGSNVLLLVAELGFLGYFVGGGLTVELLKGTSATSGSMVIERIPEWGQMLAAGRDHMLNEPWMLLGPGLAFALAILGLNLLGEALSRLADPLRSR